MLRRTARFGTCSALLLVLVSAPSFGQHGATEMAAQPEVPWTGEIQEIVDKGLRVEFSVRPVSGSANAPVTPTAGEFAEVRFRISDERSGAPVSPLQPAVWISRERANEPDACKDRIGRYIQGMLSYQADVDLNKYFILVMNNDQSISVIDPLLGVSGITQLFTMIILEDRGEDWTRSLDNKRLYVSMPRADKVAVVDLDSFKVLASVEAGVRPMRVALQPDGRYLWVANEGEEEDDKGVTVIDPQSLEIVAQIATGAGHHEIDFSADSLFALVTNRDSNTVSVIDTQRLQKLRDLPTGERPMAVQISALSEMAYVASEDGILLHVDPSKGVVRERVSLGSDLRAFRLDPSGRWGFAASASENRVDVLDTSTGKVVHQLNVDQSPHQFAFTDTYAYVRHLGSPKIALIRLSQLSGKSPPGLSMVPIGTRSPEEYAFPALADSISPTGEWASVVASNPSDKMVYYYMEGMIGPMGSYPTYGRVPRAVSIVDRSVRETARGVYSAQFRVPTGGDYDVAFLLDSPWVDHCFAFTAAPNPTLAAAGSQHGVRVDFLNEQRQVVVGQTLELRFVLSEPATGAPLSGLNNVVVLATRPPGAWQRRRPASPLEDGRYQVSVPADEAGTYYVSVAVPSLGIDFADLPFMTFNALPGDGPEKRPTENDSAEGSPVPQVPPSRGE
ncbi:MAG: cytochrome D1 [Deltaproteobacteria bacterium]|nr:cytochrome D1 [Deltaproteobacteria bacterium]